MAPQEGASDRDLVAAWVVPLRQHWRRLAVATILAGATATGLSYLIPKTYKATTTFMVPQVPDSSALAALASLGALAGMTGLPDGNSSAEQYVSLMRSNTVQDRIIARFGLRNVYGSDYQFQARDDLKANTDITLGKKDGFITIDLEDQDPVRAANMANAYVEELRRLSNSLSLTEAQRRRAFFENQLRDTHGRLTQAQQALQSSNYSAEVIRVTPEASAQGYARLKAEVTNAEVTLGAMRATLTESSTEVRQQSAKVEALRKALQDLEVIEPHQIKNDKDYVSLYREFKYQETLYDLLAKQYELAKAEEAREGVTIQIIDAAITPEHKYKPKRALLAALSGVLTLIVYAFFIVSRHASLGK